MAVVAELGDAGALDMAIKRRIFANHAGVHNLQAIYLTLLEVAIALRHLHGLNIVHRCVCALVHPLHLRA